MTVEACEKVSDHALTTLKSSFFEPMLADLECEDKILSKIINKCVGPYQAVFGTNYQSEMIKSYMSSSRETRYGDWLQTVAERAAELRFGSIRSVKPLDYAFFENTRAYILEIKSGDNWGNSSQWKQLATNFDNIELQFKGLRTINVLAHAGMEKAKQRRGKLADSHYLLEGPNFWKFQTGHTNFFSKYITPIFGHFSLDNLRAKYQDRLSKLVA
jgi:hypothetical protein